MVSVCSIVLFLCSIVDCSGLFYWPDLFLLLSSVCPSKIMHDRFLFVPLYCFYALLFAVVICPIGLNCSYCCPVFVLLK